MEYIELINNFLFDTSVYFIIFVIFAILIIIAMVNLNYKYYIYNL
jgi:hypothetical protein